MRVSLSLHAYDRIAVKELVHPIDIKITDGQLPIRLFERQELVDGDVAKRVRDMMSLVQVNTIVDAGFFLLFLSLKQ